MAFKKKYIKIKLTFFYLFVYLTEMEQLQVKNNQFDANKQTTFYYLTFEALYLHILALTQTVTLRFEFFFFFRNTSITVKKKMCLYFVVSQCVFAFF